MANGLNDEELAGLSDEELAALEDDDVGTAAETARAAKAAALPDDGDRGDADGDDDDAGTGDDAGADAAAAEAAAQSDDAGDGDGDAADEPTGLRLAAPTTEGHDEQINKLLDERKALRQRYREGDLTAEEKDAKEDEINDQIADLRADKKNAQFVENFNQQAAETEYINTVTAVKASILEKDGIDYDKSPLLIQRWDLKIRELASDPANAQRPGRWFLEQAHKAVMTELDETANALGYKRGDAKGDTDAATVRAAVKARKPAATNAKSLASLPLAAQDTGHAGGEFSHLEGLDGIDLEMALAKMTPDQERRYLSQ